jgi:hypothetical protein
MPPDDDPMATAYAYPIDVQVGAVRIVDATLELLAKLTTYDAETCRLAYHRLAQVQEGIAAEAKTPHQLRLIFAVKSALMERVHPAADRVTA